MSHLCPLHSLDCGFRGQWSSHRKSFWQERLLIMTLHPYSLSFNVFSHTTASVDGCCLYIIIHHGMSQWDCRKGSVPRGGRPGPESFKAIDTYTHRESHTNSPCVCPRMCYNCPYNWLVIIPVECKWFTSVDHMFVELCNQNFRYISQFLQVGCGPVIGEMLPYPKVLGWDVNCISIYSIQWYIHHHSVILIMCR